MLKTVADRRVALRALLTGPDLHVPAAIFDPVSARIAAQLGFRCGFLSGALVSFSRLGAPDLTLLSLEELAGQARQISRATDLPILADGDHGYGNALNVKRTVEELEMAGVAGLVLEDTLLPSRAQGIQLISAEEACGKFRAALDARTDADLVVVARTNLAALEPAEAADRAAAYLETGVDALFLAGVKSAEDVPASVAGRAALVILPAPPAALDPDALRSAGGRLLLKNGHDTFVAATKAIREVLGGLAAAGPAAKGLPREDYAALDQLVGGPDARDWLSNHGG